MVLQLLIVEVSGIISSCIWNLPKTEKDFDENAAIKSNYGFQKDIHWTLHNNNFYDI